MIDRFAAAMFCSVLIASISQVLLKMSTTKTHRSVLGEYLNKYVLCGYGLLVLSMFLTIYAYSLSLIHIYETTRRSYIS